MRIKPCIERRRWGVIGWLLLSRVGFAQRETKKPPIRRFFCISRKSGSGTSHLANGLKLLTFGEAYRQELALNSGRAASQTASFRLVLSCKQWLWSMLGSLHRKLTIELGLMLCLVHRYNKAPLVVEIEAQILVPLDSARVRLKNLNLPKLQHSRISADRDQD